jgi:hypothetical protein
MDCESGSDVTAAGSVPEGRAPEFEEESWADPAVVPKIEPINRTNKMLRSTKYLNDQFNGAGLE